MQNTNKPVHAFRYGNVSCAIWADNSPSGYFFNTTFTRVFRLDDSWGESASFGDRDLPDLMKAAADSHSWIHQRKAQANEASTATDSTQNSVD